MVEVGPRARSHLGLGPYLTWALGQAGLGPYLTWALGQAVDLCRAYRV